METRQPIAAVHISEKPGTTGVVFVYCDDGTVWRHANGQWQADGEPLPGSRAAARAESPGAGAQHLEAMNRAAQARSEAARVADKKY